MIEVHLRALEQRIKAKASNAKTIDHWNNQVANYATDNFFMEAVFFDFGKIEWKGNGTGIKTGNALLVAHCANKNTRPTKEKAQDEDGKRLKRFDWPNQVMQAIEGFTGKDKDGQVIIKITGLVNSEFDTNHDALTDDELTFSCLLYYYDTWREKGWKEIILEEVKPVYDATIEIP